MGAYGFPVASREHRDWGRHAIIAGQLHRLDDRPLRWWERLIGRKRIQWIPVEPESKG